MRTTLHIVLTALLAVAVIVKLRGRAPCYTQQYNLHAGTSRKLQVSDMAKRGQKRWMYSPKAGPKPKVPDALKQEVAARCDTLVETVLKPQHVHPPPENPQFNYIVDLYNHWHRSFFYFCARYACPGPHAIAPFFEVKYTRLEYVGDGRFNLAYMRHTNQWQEVYQGLTPDECLETIETEALFWP